MTVGATALDFLPLPPRSLQATMPYNSEAGIGKYPSPLRRALVALPLLLFYYLAAVTLGPTGKVLFPAVKGALRSSMLTTLNGSLILINSNYYGIKAVDLMAKLYVLFFMPLIGWFNKEGTLQPITFLVDIFPVHVIWIVESMNPSGIFNLILTFAAGLRLGNKFTFAKL